MIKALVLDLNGVFIESPHFSNRFENKFLVPAEEFYPIMKEILMTVRQQGIEDSFTLWKPHLEKWGGKHGFKLTREEFFNFWFAGEKLETELVEFVTQKRKEGLRVFILSNNFRERTTFYRQTYPQIFTNVDGAYFSWETGNIKPDEKAFRHVLQTNNLLPNETLFFDDSEKNVEVARSLGINAQLWPGLQKAKELISESQKSPPHRQT